MNESMQLFLAVAITYFVIISVSASNSHLTEKPKYMITCQINDPNFVKCSTRSVQRVMDEIIKNKGFPGLDNLPALDPLYVKRIKVDQSGTNAVNIKVDLVNVVITGFNQLKIVKSIVDPKDYHWETKIFLPKMTIKADYGIKGRILLINLDSHGDMLLETDNVNIDLYTSARLYEKGKFTFCNVTDAKADYSIKKLNLHFSNLFNGNKEIEDTTNAFFNENWEVLHETLKPVIQAAITKILLNYMKTLFHFIPANFFVGDIPTSKELYGQ